MNGEYWQMYADDNMQADYAEAEREQKQKSLTDAYSYEYVHMQLWNGESVKFKRVWGNHRFTDEELQYLMAGMEVRINTPTTRGIIGSLDWQEYKGRDYFGFAPWDAEAYHIGNAPFPVQWNGHEFTEEEERILRSGEKLLLVTTSARTGSMYALHISFDLIKDNQGGLRWGIVPHFEEFNIPADQFTRETCVFMPMFDGVMLSQEEIRAVRAGKPVHFEGVSRRNGKKYRCMLSLVLDKQRNRWCLKPQF